MLPKVDVKPVGIQGGIVRYLEKPEQPIPCSLYNLWRDKYEAAGKFLPSRKAFEPKDMKESLPNIYVLDVLDGGEDFMMRLFGTSLVAMFGKDYTGVKLSDSFSDEGRWRAVAFKKAAVSREPTFCIFQISKSEEVAFYTENVLLPMFGHDGKTLMLLCASELVDDPEKITDF